MEPVKWELLEEFRNQQKGRQEKIESRRQEVRDAEEKLNAAMYKSREIQIRQFQGENIEEERKKVEEELENARSAYDKAVEDLQNPAAFDEEITPEKLAEDWNENVLPKIEETHIKPIMDKMRKARYVYLKALQDYYTVADSYNNDINEVYNLGMARALQRGETPVNLKALNNVNELPLLRPEHLNSVIYQRELPDEVKDGLKTK